MKIKVKAERETILRVWESKTGLKSASYVGVHSAMIPIVSPQAISGVVPSREIPPHKGGVRTTEFVITGQTGVEQTRR